MKHDAPPVLFGGEVAELYFPWEFFSRDTVFGSEKKS